MWHKGTPPREGWYPASTTRNPAILRWWDGEKWSAGCDVTRSVEDAEALAKQACEVAPEKIEWSDGPPADPEEARVEVRPQEDANGRVLRGRSLKSAPAVAQASSSASTDEPVERKAKVAAPAAPAADSGLQRNGVHRPQRGDAAAMWAFFDTATPEDVTRDGLQRAADKAGWSCSILRGRLAQYRKFYPDRLPK